MRDFAWNALLLYGKTPEGPVYSDKPFDAISLEIDGETVEGVVVDNTVSFRFTTAENFSAAKLILNVNDGWKLVFPADPDNYDVSTDPNIYFTDPNGKKVKYVVTITSNALPVADGSKVSVEGGYAVAYNVATKAFVITYAAGMDRSKVTLVFGEGALMEGAKVEIQPLTFQKVLQKFPSQLVPQQGNSLSASTIPPFLEIRKPGASRRLLPMHRGQRFLL